MWDPSSTSSPATRTACSRRTSEAARHGLLPRPVHGRCRHRPQDGEMLKLLAADEGQHRRALLRPFGIWAPARVHAIVNEDRQAGVQEHGRRQPDYISSDCQLAGRHIEQGIERHAGRRHWAASGPRSHTPSRSCASRTASREERSPELHMAAIPRQPAVPRAYAKSRKEVPRQ